MIFDLGFMTYDTLHMPHSVHGILSMNHAMACYATIRYSRMYHHISCHVWHYYITLHDMALHDVASHRITTRDNTQHAIAHATTTTIYQHLSLYTYIYIYIHHYIFMGVYIYIYIYIYVCMYVCMYIYIYIYTYTHITHYIIVYAIIQYYKLVSIV